LARNLFLESIPAQQLSETNTLFHANTFIEKLSTGCYIFLFNCKQIIFPYPLSWDYSYNEIAVQSNSVFIILVILLVGVLLYWIVKGLLTKNILPVFGWIFLVALLPYSHLLLKIAVNTADRFLFVPSLILASIPILCYHSLPKNNTGPVKILYIFCISIILLFTYLTINQNAVWKDTLTVFRSGTETAPNSYYTQKCYGLWLSNLADSSHSQEEKTDLYTRAAASFSRSLEIYPEQQDIWYMHGRSLSMTNNYPEAKRSYLISLERFSTPKIESLYNLASLYEIVRNYDSSLIYFQKVARIDSTFNNVYASLGRVYLYKQDLGNSLSYLLRSLKQDSTNFSTLSNTGGVYYYYHDYEKAIGYYLKSVKYNKDFCSNYKNLGACWYQKRNYQTALEYYHLSYKCNPENDVLTIINSLSKK